MSKWWLEYQKGILVEHEEEEAAKVTMLRKQYDDDPQYYYAVRGCINPMSREVAEDILEHVT